MQCCIEYVPPVVDRRFWSILLISVTIHAGVLAWNRAGKVQPLELPPLVATLRTVNPVSPAPSEPLAETMPAAVPQKVRPQALKPESRSTSVVTSSAGAVGDVAQAPAPVAAAPSQEDLLANYRRRLADLLARQQEYPRVAAMRGWEGEVRVRVRVARKGSLLGVSLDHSSGYEILDKHAIAMLEGLGGLPALPEEYGSSELQVVVPVSYSLRKPS
jgi:protein TonB